MRPRFPSRSSKTAGAQTKPLTVRPLTLHAPRKSFARMRFYLMHPKPASRFTPCLPPFTPPTTTHPRRTNLHAHRHKKLTQPMTGEAAEAGEGSLKQCARGCATTAAQHLAPRRSGQALWLAAAAGAVRQGGKGRPLALAS